jgi:hypothetical protein
MAIVGVPPNAFVDPNDSCRLGSQELASWIHGSMERYQTMIYKRNLDVNGIRCSDGKYYPNDTLYGGCPAQ